MLLDENKSSGVLTLTAKTYIAPPSLGWGWHATITYQIPPNGSALSVFTALEKYVGSGPQYLPRMGFDIFLAKTLNHVRWYGRGPGESYPDKKQSQRIGIWEVDNISKLHIPYEVPQESGNRADTRWLELSTAGPGPAVKVDRIFSPHPFTKDKPDCAINHRELGMSIMQQHFNFTATQYSAEDIEKAAHPHDLVEKDYTLLRLDAAVAGVGTAACGPGPREEHLVKPTETSFGFILTLDTL